MRRVLFALVIGVMVSPAAFADDAPPPCTLKQPATPRLLGQGTVIGIQSPALAQADIARREARLHGAIDPRYRDDPRVIVRQQDGRIQVFDLPHGVTVKTGDHVMLHGSYRSPAAACAYIPIMITTDMPVS